MAGLPAPPAGQISRSGRADHVPTGWAEVRIDWSVYVRSELPPTRRVVLELLGMTLAHLNDAEARAEMSPRVPMLMAIRDKLARSLREEQ